LSAKPYEQVIKLVGLFLRAQDYCGKRKKGKRRKREKEGKKKRAGRKRGRAQKYPRPKKEKSKTVPR